MEWKTYEDKDKTCSLYAIGEDREEIQRIVDEHDLPEEVDSRETDEMIDLEFVEIEQCEDGYKAIWHYKATVKITLKDAFGKPYEIEIPPRAELEEEVLDGLTTGDIVECGLKTHNDKYSSTEVYYDLENEELCAISTGSGSGLMRPLSLVQLFTIAQYSIRDMDDGWDNDKIIKDFYPEKYNDYKKAYAETADDDGDYGNHEDACEAVEIDWDEEKERAFLEDCLQGWDRDEDSIAKQLDEIYDFEKHYTEA